MTYTLRIGEIENYYGGLEVTVESGKYYWGIRNCDDTVEWEEIPQSLYDELIKFQDNPAHTLEAE